MVISEFSCRELPAFGSKIAPNRPERGFGGMLRTSNAQSEIVDYNRRKGLFIAVI